MPRYLLLLTALIVGCSGSTTGPNRAPIAVAGPDLSANIGVDSDIVLDGSGSYDPDGDPLTYQWTLVAAPENSSAVLFKADEASAELSAEAIGVWVVKLVVSDGQFFSEPDVVFVRTSGCLCSDDAACGDNLWCNGEERCVDCFCQAGTQQDCSSAGGVCTTGVCDEQQDLCVTVPVDDGTDCNDDLYCTENDICTAGTCSGTARDCSHLAGACTDASCNEDIDQCDGTTSPDGTVCDDEDLCTTNDNCQGGVCLGTWTDCSHLDSSCAQGVCNPVSGNCEAQAINQGQSCEDGLYCTVGDVCQNGSCTGGSERNCPHSLDGCAQGFCNPMTDSCDLNPQPDGTPCNDADPCTFPDQCQGGACQSGPPCPLGCDTTTLPPRCHEVNPSNVGHNYLCPSGAPDLTPSSGVTIDIDTNNGTVDGNLISTAQWVWQDNEAREILVLSFSSITVPQTTTVNVYGWHPLALIACEDVTINGTIDASSNGPWAGPGGYNGGPGRQDGQGYMNGQGLHGFSQSSDPYRETGGGGGGHGRMGGAGGDSDQRSGGAGGTENGTPQIAPLVGGSGGGGGGSYYFNEGGPGGGGGGAVQITSGGALVIGPDGGVHVGGGGGRVGPPDWSSGGGGGSGGAILLEGTSVTVQGKLAANGGGGGGANSSYYRFCQTTPRPGQPGVFDDSPAAGGQGCGNGDGGPGGRGGYGSDSTGEGIQPNDFLVSGGGGGAVGRIRLNSFQNSNTDTTGAVISPNCSGGTQRCTAGAVSVW